jgi:hypothetical protein
MNINKNRLIGLGIAILPSVFIIMSNKNIPSTIIGSNLFCAALVLILIGLCVENKKD